MRDKLSYIILGMILCTVFYKKNYYILENIKHLQIKWYNVWAFLQNNPLEPGK